MKEIANSVSQYAFVLLILREIYSFCYSYGLENFALFPSFKKLIFACLLPMKNSKIPYALFWCAKLARSKSE